MKKWLAASIGASLTASLVLTACSNTTKSDSTNGASAAPTNSAAPAPAKKADLTVSVYDRGNIPAAEGTAENNRWTKWINENGPVNAKFVPIPRSDATQKFNVLFASGSAPDVINEFDGNIVNPLIEQKQLLPLDDLIAKNSVEYKKILQDYPALKKAVTSPDGKMYKIGRVLEAFPSYAIFVRADWLKKLNLDVPKTTEELYKVAKAFTEQDPDGDGKKNTYGMALSYRSDFALSMLFGDPINSYGLVNGQPSRAFENQKMATEFKKRLFDEGLIDKDFVNDKNGAKARQDYLNGRLGIYPVFVGSWFDATVTDLQTLKKTVPGADVIPIAFPKSPAGEFIPDIQSPVQATTAINASAKDPVAAIKYIDFINRPATGTALLSGLEGVHYNKDANACPKVIDPAKNTAEVAWAGDYAQSFSRLLTGKCSLIENGFNTDVPEQKAGLELYKKAQSLYLDPSKQYRFVTLLDQMPALPKDLQTSFNTVNSDITNIWLKSVLGGDKYSVEQAYKDVTSAWDKAGGKQIDEFMIKWYKESQNTSFTIKDLWDTVAKQKQMK
ncbi:ABC transporter substrate-binding protein [Paenibacillus sp. MBLB4367]|uniref:ABC transporter substrate-binding protein n=1 Tax=Paenibacillus sp. MBLB4367 TaxID=3384767 RepID=UPI003907EF74